MKLAKHQFIAHVESNKGNYEICTICDKKYANLQNHTRFIHRESVEKCSLCDGYSSNLKVHLERVHDGKLKTFQCTICDYKGLSRVEVEKHQKNVHVKQKVEEISKCLLCDKVYK